MTDLPEIPDHAPAPPFEWKRCPACNMHMPNFPLAVQGHRLNCPHDLQLALKKALGRIDELEAALADLSTQDVVVPEVAVDLSYVTTLEPVGESPLEQAAITDPTSIPDDDEDEFEDDLPPVASLR